MAPVLPDAVGAARLVLTVSVVLLLQGLVRDLCLLARERRKSQRNPPRAVQCMCVESTLGASGIVAGLVLLGSAYDGQIAMAPWGWSVLVLVTMAMGFAMKDLVVGWNPWRIFRDPDHMNIVFTWKD
jgi:F0F1-type ATP synthase assembly protein I